MEKVISARELELGYKREHSVLKNCSFDINKADFIFLTGNSGSGKTTFIKSLYGAIKPRLGILEVCGVNISKANTGSINNLRRKLGVVFQDYKLIEEWNLSKNVMLPLIIAGYSEDICAKQVEKLLTHVKLNHKSTDFPRELSGGEQQRAAVARSLVHNPAVIIADEPTGNLDEYSSEVVMGLLKTANNCGITVIIATHHIPNNFDIPYRHFHIEGKMLNEIS